jgi:hypothetical protein
METPSEAELQRARLNAHRLAMKCSPKYRAMIAEELRKRDERMIAREDRRAAEGLMPELETATVKPQRLTHRAKLEKQLGKLSNLHRLPNPFGFLREFGKVGPVYDEIRVFLMHEHFLGLKFPRYVDFLARHAGSDIPGDVEGDWACKTECGLMFQEQRFLRQSAMRHKEIWRAIRAHDEAVKAMGIRKSPAGAAAFKK